ncbi:MAG: ferredoxin [Deltaproteobacteria bacterium]|nr:ferredoxin [Deltaproteobacteria bacterium]
MITFDKDLEKDAVLEVARLMAAAARTAPKGKGADTIVTILLTADEKDRVAKRMEKIAVDEDIPFFQRDANNIYQVPAVLVVGTKFQPLGIPHCGDCGYSDCQACRREGEGRCNFNIIDLGIAMGSAASVAALHHIDNRIMFSCGKAVLELGMMPADVKIAYAIPLSITSKSPFYDR